MKRKKKERSLFKNKKPFLVNSEKEPRKCSKMLKLLTIMIEMSPLLDSYQSWKLVPDGKGLKKSGVEPTPIQDLNFE